MKKGVPALAKEYWESLVKRQITEREFGAAVAVQKNQNKDRRAKKRAGIKAICKAGIEVAAASK